MAEITANLCIAITYMHIKYGTSNHSVLFYAYLYTRYVCMYVRINETNLVAW